MTSPGKANGAYALELAPPDISAWRAGNTGIDHVLRFASAEPGPHVLLTALVHGNELCGAIALDWLLRRRIEPRRGTLTLAFCNVAAFARFDPADPVASRFVEEDFNRVWGLDVLEGSRDTVETRRARALRPVVDAADYLLDIHTMQHPTAPLMLCGPLAKGRTWARRVGFPEMVVADAGHAAGKRMRDYGAFGDPASPRNALLVECGQHWERSSAEVAIETMLRVLVDLRTFDPGDAAGYLPRAPRPPAGVIEVTDAITVRGDEFAFVAEYRGMEVVERAGTVIAHDGGVPVATPHDRCVLIMPSRRLRPGQTAVRLGRFVD
jgi:succinylglutamate desuccinylase